MIVKWGILLFSKRGLTKIWWRHVINSWVEYLIPILCIPFENSQVRYLCWLKMLTIYVDKYTTYIYTAVLKLIFKLLCLNRKQDRILSPVYRAVFRQLSECTVAINLLLHCTIPMSWFQAIPITHWCDSFWAVGACLGSGQAAKWGRVTSMMVH